MSGADEHATSLALENRRRAREESKTLLMRYGQRGGASYKLAQLLTLSIVDVLVALLRNLKWVGLHATEI